MLVKQKIFFLSAYKYISQQCFLLKFYVNGSKFYVNGIFQYKTEKKRAIHFLK